MLNRSKEQKKSSANPTAFAELCKILVFDEPSSKKELAEKAGIAIGTVIKWMRLLKKRNLVHIVFYDRESNAGHYAAYWSWGDKKDAPKPKGLTAAEYSRRSRARKSTKILTQLGTQDHG